jgi:hypothetical protein
MPKGRTSTSKLDTNDSWKVRLANERLIYEIQQIATEDSSENFEEGTRLSFISLLSTSAIDSQTPPEKRKPLHKAGHDKA